MLLTDVIKRVQRIFGDEAEVQISQADIIAWASDGQVEIARQTECLTKTQVSNYDPATAKSWTLPADFILEKRVTWTDTTVVNKPLGKTTLDLLDSMGTDLTLTSSTPSLYYLWGGSIYIYPLPTAVVTQAVTLWYVNAPPALTVSSDPLTIPLHMQEDIVRYAIMRARELNEDVEQASRIEAGIASRLVQSKSEAFNPYKDQYPVVRDYAGDMWW